MKTVEYNVKYSEKASRLELFVRILWAIPTAIVMFILLIIAAIASILQFLHILLLGKRSRMFHDWINKFVAYFVKYECYKNMLTEERSPIMPED